MTELKVYGQQADELFKAFQKEHAYFDAAWSRSQRDNPYYNERYLFQMQELHTDIRIQVGRLADELAPFLPSGASSSVSTASAPGKLPELALPTFAGDYTKCPAYCELFSALIINRKDLTDIERLQYLLSSPGRRTSPEGRGSTFEGGFLHSSLGNAEGGVRKQMPSHPGTAG